MIELEFVEMTVKNFLSIGNQEVCIQFDRGINFVWGWNYATQSSNGVGKSLLYFNAPLYALFGDANRGTKQNSLINYINKSNMFVSLKLQRGSQEFYIYRSRKPNDFYFTVNGELYKNKDMNDTQHELEKMLDISEEIFKNAFIINASNVIDFVSDSGSVKLKENFERIFFKNLIFKKILDTIRKELNELVKKIEKNEGIIAEKSNFLKTLDTYKETAKDKENIEEKIKLYKKALDVLNVNLSKIKTEKVETSDIEEKIVKLQKKYKLEFQNKIKTETNVYHLKEKLQEIVDNMSKLTGDMKECPLCHQALSNTKVKELEDVYKQSQDKFNSDIINSQKNIQTLKSTLITVKNFETDLNKKIRDLENKGNEEKVSISVKINNIKNSIVQFEESHKRTLKIKNDYGTVEKELKIVEKENVLLDQKRSDLLIMSELFDNRGGILNYFIEKVLVTLNATISKFIKKMKLDFHFQFDRNLKLKFDLYDNIDLGNFSAGEQKALNFVILFSLIEFFFNTIGFKPSMIVIDEILDTTLSENKTEVVFEILNEFHKQSNIGIYLLSHDFKGIHNPVFTFDSIIKLMKKDGFTSVDEIEFNK